MIAATAVPLASHPHVFIDAGANLIFDDAGQLAAVRVFWAYDEFYSMLLIEDNGLDTDGDGTPEQAALDAYAGKDVDWDAGFPGDLYLQNEGADVGLSGPVEHGMRYEEGRVVSWHIRPLKTRLKVGSEPVLAQIYDPTFFVAYDLHLPVTVEGAEACAVEQIPADLGAAYDKVESLLYGPDSAEYSEDSYPEVGHLFADKMLLTCSE
ncbi:ABC-type uncharacterized transport system, substrate-binding protein [Aliiroseovarius halocynthiae]|uniref:DUF1007 family protein n=2 Tax=Aliiroseovarius halocynthiae TaxID=985055 RepID=A0A545SL19_9RHOB|nr:DUF1007 family protein [Aliiroseovarius halocynthiae]SMR84070.1 ABC-type uncharacterized transport system, substrate-binding protein [Aliiroseovarius halocynthiae]